MIALAPMKMPLLVVIDLLAADDRAEHEIRLAVVSVVIVGVLAGAEGGAFEFLVGEIAGEGSGIGEAMVVKDHGSEGGADVFACLVADGGVDSVSHNGPSITTNDESPKPGHHRSATLYQRQSVLLILVRTAMP